MDGDTASRRSDHHLAATADRAEFDSRMMRQTRMREPARFDYIDALRGLAILGVVLTHSGVAVRAESSWLNTLIAGGARGVQLFYIASAITLCLSWNVRARHEDAPIRNFYLRRLFRIVPMFYLAIAGYVALYGFEPQHFSPNGLEWYYIPLTALFLNGFHPETITSVVPGGWSIVVEMTFYAVLPLLVSRFRTLSSLALLLAVSLVLDRIVGRIFRIVYLPLYPPDQAYLVDALTFLNFFAQFPVFVLGMMAFVVIRRAQQVRALTIGVPLLAAWIALWPMATGVAPAHLVTLHIPVGAGFALLAVLLSRRRFAALVNPMVIGIGKLSFSMYLIHFAVIEALARLGISARFGAGDGAALFHYLLVVAATTAIAVPCHRFIEQPGIEAGRRLIGRRPLASAAA
jgi:peptidoglycan/LPS O-acetylase OafA/YrhL